MGLKAMSLFLCHPPSFPVQLTLREVETGSPQCGGDGASLTARGAAGGAASDPLKQQPACAARGGAECCAYPGPGCGARALVSTQAAHCF